MSLIPKVYTVESVTSGHPDKMCDQISDAILDECLRQDPHSRVAIEVFGSHGFLVIGGEVTTTADVNYDRIARDVYYDIGYRDELDILVKVSEQCAEIAHGVNSGGAGDQGIMYGFATNETVEAMPFGVVLANSLTTGLEMLRMSEEIKWLRPDGKSQVTVKGKKAKTILISTQHDYAVTNEVIRKTLKDKLFITENVRFIVNPSGQFMTGGFEADAGLTGRKIMVDTYGGFIPHGGGAFSGKDPTKVDRSAAYMCRFVAKNIVKAGLAKECLVSVAYAIGLEEPLMVEAINEKGKKIDIAKKFDFRPSAIIERLDLRRPIYQETACYGHFGRPGLPWEEKINI